MTWHEPADVSGKAPIHQAVSQKRALSGVLRSPQRRGVLTYPDPKTTAGGNLIRKLVQEAEKRVVDNLARLNERLQEPNGLENAMRSYGVTAKKDTVDRLKAKVIREVQKTLDEDIRTVFEVMRAEDWGNRSLTITVEWTRSSTWGKNPRAYTNYGFEGGSISGCGYDKLSTATAQALNSCLPLLKLMYIKKNKHINKSNHELLGYGSGYGVLPKFEGGVGTSSHQRICEGLGLKMQGVTSTNNTDVFVVSGKPRTKRVVKPPF